MSALRALFVNEGAPASGPVGHPRVEASLRLGLQGSSEIEARFVSLPSAGALAHAAVRGAPGLRSADLDLQQLRWHLTQSARVRRLLREELRRGRFDVAHIVTQSVALLAAAEMRKVPVLLSVDATVRQVRSMALARPLRRHSMALMRPSMALERRAFAAAAMVLPWSTWAREGVLSECADARTELHHFGLDLERFAPAPEARGDLPRVLMVGGRFEAKGGYDLIEALGPELGRSIELDVVTHDYVAPRPGLRRHSLPPEDPQLVRLYQRCDVFCLPSHGDTFGWAILEAMACGAPVVASDVGAIAEVLGNGAYGVLVAPHSPRELREATLGLIADQARQTRLSEQGRQRCERLYDARTQGQRLLDIMREVAS